VTLAPGTRSPAERYVAGLAPGSRRAQAAALVRLARLARLLGADDPRTVAWWKLAPELVDALRAQLADQAAPATVNRVLSALRGTLHAAWRAGLMDAATYQAARGARGSRLPGRRAVGMEEWASAVPRDRARAVADPRAGRRPRRARLRRRLSARRAGGARPRGLRRRGGPPACHREGEQGAGGVHRERGTGRASRLATGARPGAWPAAVARGPSPACPGPAAHRADGVRPAPPPRRARWCRRLLAA